MTNLQRKKRKSIAGKQKKSKILPNILKNYLTANQKAHRMDMKEKVVQKKKKIASEKKIKKELLSFKKNQLKKKKKMNGWKRIKRNLNKTSPN